MQNIVQIFPTIQGEGNTVGEPAILIRFKDCNLSCPFCDTKWSKKLGIIENPVDIINNILKEYKIKKLLISGGEPFLYLEDIFELLDQDFMKNISSIEIETNGMLITSENLTNLNYNIKNINNYILTQLNISPKLDPVCYKVKKNGTGYNPDLESLIFHFNDIITELRNNFCYIIKIVHYKDIETKILRFINAIDTNYDKIFMMPLTIQNNKIKTLNNHYKTIEFCLKYGFKYGCREQTWLFDKKNIEERV